LKVKVTGLKESAVDQCMLIAWPVRMESPLRNSALIQKTSISWDAKTIRRRMSATGFVIRVLEERRRLFRMMIIWEDFASGNIVALGDNHGHPFQTLPNWKN